MIGCFQTNVVGPRSWQTQPRDPALERNAAALGPLCAGESTERHQAASVRYGGAGATVLQKRLTRSRLLRFFEKLPPCLVGIEACATSHHWARELTKFGHEVKLMPAQYVKPYVKRQKNDMADAEAIAEAVTRPSMRFVGQKSPEQQSAMMLHKVRLMLNRQLIMLVNALRAHMAEFGLLAPVGRSGIDHLIAIIENEADARIATEARQCLLMLVAQLKIVKLQSSRTIAGLWHWHGQRNLGVGLWRCLVLDPWLHLRL